MPQLRERFTRTQWKDCCGKGCKKCRIAAAYVSEYGKKEGLARLSDDRAAVKAVKKAEKADGKKAGKAAGKKARQLKAGKAGKKARQTSARK
jgi:hypothetical protein